MSAARGQGERSGTPQGRVFVAALLVFLAVAAGATGAVALSLSEFRVGSAARDRVRAGYCAEGGLEAAERQLLDAVVGRSETTIEGSVEVGGESVSFSAVPTGLGTVRTDPGGLRREVQGYRLVASTLVGGCRVELSRFVNVVALPVFQFAVFGAQDLELCPGPTPELRGRLHANGDLFLGGGPLSLDTSSVQARRIFLRGETGGLGAGGVRVRRWVRNPFDPREPLEYAELGQPADGHLVRVDDEVSREPQGYAGGSGTTFRSGRGGAGNGGEGATAGPARYAVPGPEALARFVRAGDGDHQWNPRRGRHEPVPPGSGSFFKGALHASADLALIVHPDGGWSAEDRSGRERTDELAGIADVVSRRERGEVVPVLSIDLGRLNASEAFPANGLLYASCGAVRLENGSELAAPLTVASDGSVAIRGDYNTVRRKGAAVIADSIHLLSNAWDEEEPGDGPPRPATRTIYNVAVIAGMPGGGACRPVDLLQAREDWSGVACTVQGAFVSFWASGSAPPSGGLVRSGDGGGAGTPERRWSYDPAYNTVANLPPFTPIVATCEDVVTW